MSRVKKIIRRLEHDRARASDTFRRIVENLRGGYFFYRHDASGVFTYLSSSITDVLGYTQEEFLSHYTEYLTDDPINRQVIEHTEGSLRGEQQPSYEVDIFHKDGSRHRLEVSEFPVLDLEGRVEAVEGIAHDVTRRRADAASLRSNEARLEGLLRITQYRARDTQDLLDFALNEAVRLTGSRIGYIYHYDEDRREFHLNTWSKDVMAACSVQEKMTVYSLEKTGFWGEAVRQRKPLILNDYKAPHPLKKGVPPGHAELRRFMTVPVIQEERIVAVVGVANKAEPYDDSDVRQLTLLMDSVWRILGQRELEVSRQHTEERLARINEYFLSQSHDAQENLQRLVALCGSFLPGTSICYSRIDGRLQRIVSGYRLPPGLPTAFESTGRLCHAVFLANSGEPLVLRDLPRSRFAQSDPFVSRFNLRTYLGQVVRTKNAPVGVLCVASDQDLAFSSEDVKLVCLLAAAIGFEERRHELEEQFLQAQKMDAVGRLAGGVAHDFNNMLTAIKGFAEFLQSGLADGDARRADVLEILDAADRATALTRQLLAFSRKQVLAPRVVAVDAVVSGLSKMLRRILGEDIRLSIQPDPGRPRVRIDPGQFEQVLLNLAVNSRDAMPRGGTLSLVTRVIQDLPSGAERLQLAPGAYLELSVTDTGCGMSAEVLSHVFEPFFTTKEKGKGTGLGLSTVYGIIKQSGGSIDVRSAPGEGTTFILYLPMTQEPEHGQEDDGERRETAKGSETILVVEDEPMVREMTRRVLESKGYRVLDAASGGQAMKLLRSHEGPLHLLLTDVIMPGMNGRELAERIKTRHPEARVLFFSGYADEALGKHGILEPGVLLLQKPFTVESLALKVREALDGPEI